MEGNEVFNVVVWFNNGESRTFGATHTHFNNGILAIKLSNETTAYFNGHIIAGFMEPTDEDLWEEYK